MSMQPHSKKRVCYYYDSDIGNYYYGQGHPMKPHRIRMTHNLLLNYGLYRKMEIYRPHKATSDEMTKFHSDDYVRFLRSIRPDNMSEYNKQMQRFNVGEDCPVFDGLYEFCQLSAGGSVAAAVKLNKQASEICINWGGGLHHAKKSEASGFCYVNDIVLGILELLKYHQRVLYIDIDVHHGDGVEEAFYTTDRVMTVSFHKYGEYFPGTGDLRDIGAGKGKYYAVNIPLRDGMDDDAYDSIFVPIIAKVMETFQPSAVVLQCGADSLTGDRLGCFNLTVKGHGKCVEFVKKYNLPFLMVGGGGYTIRNVSRCWTYETSVALGVEIANELPYNDYFEYFGPDFKLHISPSNMANQNTAEYLEKIKTRLFENLRMLPHAPGVQIQAIPEDAHHDESEDEDKIDKDDRLPQSDKDKRIVPDNEFSDSEDEGEGGRRDQRSYKGQRKRPRLDKVNSTDSGNSAAASATSTVGGGNAAGAATGAGGNSAGAGNAVSGGKSTSSSSSSASSGGAATAGSTGSGAATGGQTAASASSGAGGGAGSASSGSSSDGSAGPVGANAVNPGNAADSSVGKDGHHQDKDGGKTVGHLQAGSTPAITVSVQQQSANASAATATIVPIAGSAPSGGVSSTNSSSNSAATISSGSAVSAVAVGAGSAAVNSSGGGVSAGGGDGHNSTASIAAGSNSTADAMDENSGSAADEKKDSAAIA